MKGYLDFIRKDREEADLLFNVVKHAGVEQASVAVSANLDGVEIVVQDHGRGFALPRIEQPATSKQGFGMFSIRERITYSGGTMETQSSPGKGTFVRLRVPLSTAVSEKSKIINKVDSVARPALSRLNRGGDLRVLLVDDHAIFREGLMSILEEVDGIARSWVKPPTAPRPLRRPATCSRMSS